jgi:hypothetical protein
MHASDMGRQFVLPVESFAPSNHATSTCRDLTPEVRFVGGVQGCVMPSKLGLTSECLAFTPFSFTHELAIAEYRADPYNNIIHLVHCGSGIMNLLFSLLCECCIAWIVETWEMRRIRMNCHARKWHALHHNWISLEGHRSEVSRGDLAV